MNVHNGVDTISEKRWDQKMIKTIVKWEGQVEKAPALFNHF